MGAIETLRDALFGNPPQPNTEPSREGVLAAIAELKIDTDAGIAAAALSGTDLDAAMELVAPLLTSAQAAQTAAGNALSQAMDAAEAAETAEAAAVQAQNDVAQALTSIAATVASQLDEAVETATASATASSLQAAQDAEAAALSAATAEAAAGPTYASIAAGLAATTDGEAFAVDNGDGTVTVYLNVAGSEDEQRTLATTDALASDQSGRGLDLIGRPTVAGLLASTAPARGVGALWYADDFRYVEAASGATDHHVATAGGVKLYVQPGPRGYDVRAFGARDDWDGSAGTNNFAVFEKVPTLRPVPMVLPRSRGGTGVYMTNGTTGFSDLTGLVIDNDPGVSIWVSGDIPFTFAKGWRSTRDLRIDYDDLRYQRTGAPDMRKRLPELGRPASALDGQLQVPARLDFTDAVNLQLSAWPNGSFDAGTPTSVGADLLQWGTAPAGTFVASVFQVLPGDFIQAKVSDETTYLPAICIVTEDGWVLVRQSQTTGQSTIIFTERVGVANSVETSTVNTEAAQTTYLFAKAAVGIVVYDQRSFGLVLNGTVIRRYRTTSNITLAGWAGGFGTAGNFAISNPVLFKNKNTFGIKPLKVITIGDSTGDETVTQQSQFDFMRQYIGGIGGCQIETLTNLATSGDTSAAQLSKLEAFNGGSLDGLGYDYCLIQIGINDIQTNVTPATFVSNVLAMTTYVRAAGIEPIVGLPAMFYSQADAQAFDQDGGATSRSDLGAGHRLALMQALADNRIYCNLASFEDMGAVVASLLSMKTSPWGDQVVYDNIHPTTWGTMLLGYGWAKAVSAHATGAAEHDFADGVLAVPLPVAYASGSVGATSMPRYTVDNGTFSLSYYLSVNGASLPDNTTVIYLPKRLWPKADVFGVLSNVGPTLDPVSAAPGMIKISTDGAVRVYGVAGSPTFLGISASWKV